MATDEKYFEFDPDNADSWYQRLKPEDQQKLTNAVFRANKTLDYLYRNKSALPSHYRGVAKRINASMKLTDEQVYALDQQIVKTLYDQDIWAQIMAGAGITKSVNRWQSKNYKINETNIPWPKLSRDFRNPPVFQLGVEPEGFKGIGCAIAYEIPWTEIEEAKGGIYDPDYYHALVAGERMGILLDSMGFHGTASAYATAGNPDLGIKGLANHSSVQSFTATGLTTRLGIRTALFNALEDLAKVYQQGKTILVTTKGIHQETLLRIAGFHEEVSEFDIIERDFFDTGLIDEWWVTDRLYNSTSDPSNSQQVMLLAKIGPMLQKNQVVYPLQTKPMTDKQYSDDIKEALLYGNVFCQYGVSVHPVTIATGLTTTGSGVIQNGRVL